MAPGRGMLPASSMLSLGDNPELAPIAAHVREKLAAVVQRASIA